MAVHFDGYMLNKSGRPTFRYLLNEGGRGAVLRIAESPAPVKTAAATGLSRTFALEVQGGYQAWLLAGVTNKDVRAIRPGGGDVYTPVRAAAGSEVATEGLRVVLPAEGDRAIVMEAVGAPEGTAWRFVPQTSGGWQVLLRFPESKDPWKGHFALVLWALPKDDPTLIKDLTVK
jgi:hypothetical protein